jgi:hypothetical protein
MNDFTKDELETILDLFHYAEDSPCWRETKGWDDVLKVKIQSMIDNYHCNHESDGQIYTSNPSQNRCKDCGEFYR